MAKSMKFANKIDKIKINLRETLFERKRKWTKKLLKEIKVK